MTKLVKPFKIHGGKHYLAKKIISLMPPHKHYVEPFAGGLSVLLARSGEGVSEVVNDLDSNIYNFWKVIADSDMFGIFKHRVNNLPFSEELFKEHRSKTNLLVHPVERAVSFFVVMRQSRQGLGKDFATLSRNRTRRGMNEQVSSWLTAVEGLPGIHKRLKRVVVLCHDAVKVVEQQDGKHTLFYCDPPYVHSTRSSTGEYSVEMTDKQHMKLLETLSSIRGKFILSGYHCSMYDLWARKNKFKCVDVVIDNKASSKGVKDKKTEALWCKL